MSACQRCGIGTFGRLCGACAGERPRDGATRVDAGPLRRCPLCGSWVRDEVLGCAVCAGLDRAGPRLTARLGDSSRPDPREILDRWMRAIVGSAAVRDGGRVSAGQFRVWLLRLVHELRAAGALDRGDGEIVTAHGWGALITGRGDDRHLFTLRDTGAGHLRVDGEIAGP